MWVTLPRSLAILEYFNYGRFGEIALGLDRQYQPTAVFAPGSAEAEALFESNLQSESRWMMVGVRRTPTRRCTQTVLSSIRTTRPAAATWLLMPPGC
ncbi:hypothetical protein BH23ACT6_BH23ACT6_02060 [soil metagenome]